MMIVFTTKMTRRKVVSTVLVICILICSCVVYFSDSKTSESVSVTDSNLSLKSIRLKTNRERIELLKSFGWEVEEEPLETMEVRIPQEFDGIYEEYNDLQKKQGFDLEKYSGKKVMRYTYRIKNYEGEDEAIANLILYKNKIIAGDICSPRMDGFMHGLSESSETTIENNADKTGDDIKVGQD